MRCEVMVGDESLKKHEFACEPRPGDLIEVEGGTLVVEKLSHVVAERRAKVICRPKDKKSWNPKTEPEPEVVPSVQERFVPTLTDEPGEDEQDTEDAS